MAFFCLYEANNVFLHFLEIWLRPVEFFAPKGFMPVSGSSVFSKVNDFFKGLQQHEWWKKVVKRIKKCLKCNKVSQFKMKPKLNY